MAIVAGFDVHRAQITFDALDSETGEIYRGRMRAEPEAVRAWVAQFAGAQVDVAVEACTGWLFVCEALAEAGAVAHLAEPAEVSALRGRKRHAKTDRADARWLRTLLCEGRLPESWIPPAHVREWRTRTRLRKTLVDERTSWVQRIQATLFHHGIANVPDQLLRTTGRAFLGTLELPPAAAQRIEIALAIIDEIDRQLIGVERELGRLARRQPGCQALMRQYERAADGHDNPGRARRRLALVGLAQGRPLLRAGHWRAPLRSPLAPGPARAPRLTATALGAI
jgi:transposase